MVIVMSNVRILNKIKNSEDIEELRKIAKKLFNDIDKVEAQLSFANAHTEDGHKVAKKWKDEAEFYKGHVERVGIEAMESGERLMKRTRNETLELAAEIAENFFNDDVIEGFQIAKAIRDQIPIINDTPRDDSFVIKTMNDVVARANARRR
jgi:hypothetical protein